MKLKIISEGTGRNTKIVSVETGEVIEGVTEVTWHCRYDSLADVTMKFINIPVEVMGELDVTQLGDEWRRKLPGKEEGK